MPKVIFECDGCGRQECGSFNNGSPLKPHDWYIRTDKDGSQVACSRNCIEIVSAKSGKTSLVLPI